MNSKTSTRNGSTASLLSDNDSLSSSVSGEHTLPASEASITTTSIDRETLDVALTYTTDDESSSDDGDDDDPLLSYRSEPSRTEREIYAHAHLAADQDADNGSNHKALGHSEILLSALKIQPGASSGVPRDDPPEYTQKAPTDPLGIGQIPLMNVVMHVVGLYSDIQPFVALGNVLKTTCGHRVRLATHPCFKGLVEENGLEFFSIGGDPAELAGMTAKNTGQISPSKWRTVMQEIFNSCWKSCIEPSKYIVAGTTGPFVADVIIANPPSFAHIHCAEKLGIPLHLMSTAPWSPSQAFPHPLAKIRFSDCEQKVTNLFSYYLVEMIVWGRLGDIINQFRQKTLALEPLNLAFAPGLLSRLKIPFTYCWSPALLPKPQDWDSHINICGFFKSASTSFIPEAHLTTFLNAGPPPIFVELESAAVDEPLQIISRAINQTGVRAVVSSGCTGHESDKLLPLDKVLILNNNIPHEWLFPRVSCVIHHGGADITASGLAYGKPTIILPLFGDQFFWGEAIARAGVGPTPIPYKSIKSDSLAGAIAEALSDQCQQRARKLATEIQMENGATAGALNLHEKLKVEDFRCSLAPHRLSVWRVKGSDIRLSTLAATILAKEGGLDLNDVELYRTREHQTEAGPCDPISGVISAAFGTVSEVVGGVAYGPIQIYNSIITDNGEYNEYNAPECLKQFTLGAGKGVSRILGAGLKSPAFITHDIAQGFHNLPKLYGDTTVRESEKISDIPSGLRAAGKEFAYGLYDGLSGFVTQPLNGAKKEGAAGFFKGFAKGVGGVVCKPAAGACALPGYAFMGVYKEIQHRIVGPEDKDAVDEYVRKVRIAQGEDEWKTATKEEKMDILHSWKALRSDDGGKVDGE